MLLKMTKAAVWLGGATLAAGAALYEGALNTKLISTFKEIFNKEDPEVDALYEGQDNLEAHAWFEANKGKDETIHADKTGNTHAYIIRNPRNTHLWVICCHGYTSDPEATAIYAKHFYDRGYSVISPAMRGFSVDENRYCTMGYLDKYILAAWANYIALNDPEAKIVLHGYSMGGATVNNALGEPLPEQVKAAVSDCAYTNVYEQYTYVLKHNAKLPPFPLLDAANAVSQLKGNMDFRKNSPIEALKKAKVPVIFLHGDADDFVPFFMLERMYEACPTKKEKVVIHGAKHAVSVFKDPGLYWSKVDAFLDEVLP